MPRTSLLKSSAKRSSAINLERCYPRNLSITFGVPPARIGTPRRRGTRARQQPDLVGHGPSAGPVLLLPQSHRPPSGPSIGEVWRKAAI